MCVINAHTCCPVFRSILHWFNYLPSLPPTPRLGFPGRLLLLLCLLPRPSQHSRGGCGAHPRSPEPEGAAGPPVLLLLLRPAPRAGRPTAQPSCVPRSCPALAGKWAAGESRRAQAAGHGHRALGGGGRGSGLDAPRALRRWLLRRRDGCAFVPAAFCSFSPDSCCLCAAPSTWTWTVPPSTPAPREVTLASRWISSCPARLRKWPHFEGGVGPPSQ